MNRLPTMAEIRENRRRRAEEVSRRMRGLPNPLIVEVGVEVGHFSRAILAAVPKAHLFMVDNWRPEDQQTDLYRNTGDPSAHKTPGQQRERRAQAARLAEAHSDRCTLIAMSSGVASRLFADETFDLVFLDADHSFAGVCADLAAWAPKVKPGGWLGGHDYDNPHPTCDFSGVKAAVDRYFQPERIHTGVDFTWWRRRG